MKICLKPVNPSVNEEQDVCTMSISARHNHVTVIVFKIATAHKHSQFILHCNILHVHC